MSKHAITSVGRKNRITDRIIDRLVTGEQFLMLGHENPDEDCIAAMVSSAILVSKFDKKALLHISGDLHEQHQYLVDICNHNAIGVVHDVEVELPPIDTIVVCDTPKPEMVAMPSVAAGLFDRPDVVTIEFDHHIAADTAYIGDEDYALVTEASSACELVGYLALKLCNRPDLLERYHIGELFSRNLVLSVLTGIIGDSKMGKFLKSRRERRFYDIFSGMFNALLSEKTTKRSNFSNKEEVFDELVRLSAREEACSTALLAQAEHSALMEYVLLDEEDSRKLFERFDPDTIVTVARSVADVLAERSGRLSMIAYYDFTPDSDHLVQFRVRRSHALKSYDVRRIIDRFGIENGGGHEGAIGFRFGREAIPDFDAYTAELISGIEVDFAESGA